jgi:uncharacterized protein
LIVYQAEKSQFVNDVFDSEIGEIVRQRYHAATGRRVNDSEFRSWEASLNFMARVLRGEEIPDDAGVAVEYHIPQSSKRIDMTLTGFDEAGAKWAVVVELKQWETVTATAKDAVVVTYLGHGHREVVHPSYQAWSYAALLEGFNEAVYEGGIGLRPCAYLHNYQRDGVIDSDHYAEYTDKAPLFLAGEEERRRLRAFIAKYVCRGDRGRVLYEMEHGRIRPSTALAESLSALLKGNSELVLVDEQKSAYESCKSAVEAASRERPRVVIVQGGPGSGKTVVAVNLLVALTGKGLLGKYVSKNAAPRKVYEAKLSGAMTRSRFGSLFVGSGAFVDTPANTFDFLIVDEAHRLNEKSGLYGNLGENQIVETMKSAKCAVFFIDEDQQVTFADIGTKEAIRTFARARGAEIEEYELVAQFRCNGSAGYLAWLDDVLQIHETANEDLDTREYDFQVFDDPGAMHAAIEAENGANKARVVAGYCWPWRSRKDPAAFDIDIEPGYKRRWNLDQDGSLWIISPNSIAEVGCIHTCQGLEVDYVGVIIGPDLVVRDGHVTTSVAGRTRQDQTVRGYAALSAVDAESAKARADAIIKNTYRTLMTRGMKGCYLYATDAETRDYFRSRIAARPVEAPQA